MALRHNPAGQFFFSPAENPPDEKNEYKSLDSENNQAALQKILLMTAETPEEKFRALDARDKLYKLLQNKDPTLKRGALPATCPDMCPEKERLLREYQNRGSIFEMTNFSRNLGFNHSLAVKEYARSSADQEEPLPHELRPISVLTMTMSHLLHNVADFCELSDDNLEEWYMFMWDRTRALRKDLTQQGLCCLESVTLVEQCARFHIHCAERLVDQDSSIYDDKINTENLTKCLQTLKYMYKDLAKEDVRCPNQPEFVCYSLLLNLNNSSVFTELSDMPNCLMSSEPVKFALNVMTAWETRNYIRFFDLVKRAAYLNSCLLRRYFGEMRLYAVKTMIRSYCTKNYSPQIAISRFVNNLNFEGEEECVNFLSHCNFNFRDIDGTTVVNFNRLLFQNPQTTFVTGRAFIFIEDKKRTPLSVILAGGCLPPLDENLAPNSSFDESGQLKESALSMIDLDDVASQTSENEDMEDSDGTDERADENPILPMGSFRKGEQREEMEEPLFRKPQVQQPPVFYGTPLFSTQDSKNTFTSIFGKSENSNVVPSAFQTTTKNLFESSKEKFVEKSLFGDPSPNFGGASSVFGGEKKPMSTFSFGSVSNDVKQNIQPFGSNQKDNKSNFTDANSSFKFQFGSGEREEVKTVGKKEVDEMEMLLKRKKEEEEENRRRKQRMEEENANKRLMEEKRKAELERMEREKLEREEKWRRDEEVRLANEERKRREENERLEKIREAQNKLKLLEETKRREEMEYRMKVKRKMEQLKVNWQKWKTKVMFDKWRMQAWNNIEGRKMKEYFREVKLKYPPVCSEELLNNNPYGLIIPSTLVFEQLNSWKFDFPQEAKKAKKMLIINDQLPLLKVNLMLGKVLEARARALGYKYNHFPWKLVISVPDEIEAPQSSKSIETFVEMHFVDDVHWEFGVQKGPLYCQNGAFKSFEFSACVRRLRGCKLFEGIDPNPAIVEGCNAVIFILNEEECNKASLRLKSVLKHKSPIPKVPIILFALMNTCSDPNNFRKLLEVETLERTSVSDFHIIPVVSGKHYLVDRFIESLNLAASISSCPSSLRICHLSDFFTELRLDSLWRRIGISLSNFRIVLEEPKVLIEFYNACIDHLINIFLDDSNTQECALPEIISNVELIRPSKTSSYVGKLKTSLEKVKLPHWPLETPKSSHQLNYRIHQYCKKVAGNDRLKMKNLKWLLYRIIRRSLLWKGLDIYCDEDINEILNHFPWIQVFQEISHFLTQCFTDDVKNDSSMVVVYNLDKIEKFSFESNLIGKLLKKTKRSGSREVLGKFEDEFNDSSPCLENDSVVYAYTAALERENNKRKREECVEDGLDGLFSIPIEKRFVLEEEKTFDFTEIQNNFESLNDRLDELKKRTAENASILMDIQHQLE
ncbi:hypothetical protein RUM43_013652 [Polyplax serrata]|uniref:SAC3/GANP/THP3 conserved domain-containing protein n=1 Tax=Polyplax serrata TaxID=468196 RepID=A0AAN8P0N7_POLSC